MPLLVNYLVFYGVELLLLSQSSSVHVYYFSPSAIPPWRSVVDRNASAAFVEDLDNTSLSMRALQSIQLSGALSS